MTIEKEVRHFVADSRHISQTWKLSWLTRVVAPLCVVVSVQKLERDGKGVAVRVGAHLVFFDNHIAPTVC